MAGTLKLGSIPPLSVAAGEVLSFTVASRFDSGATFSKRATPRPAGEMTLDEATGLFRYVPAPSDREEFTVWIRARKGAQEEKQKVVITPQPRLGSDFKIIQRLADLPDPAEQVYVTYAERDAGPAVFNNTADYQKEEEARIETKEVFVSGVRVVLERNSLSHPLHTLLDDRADLRRVTVCADEVVVRSPLRLPGTDVEIYARRLAFEGGGADGGLIDTTPRSVRVSAGTRDEGLKGQKAGDVRLCVGELDAPGSSVRVRANGGDGQPGRQGKKGKDGVSLEVWNGEAVTTTFYAAHETLNWKSNFGNLGGYSPVYAQIWEYYAPGLRGPWFYQFDRGTQKWPTDGSPPEVWPGRPGQGGDGGAVSVPELKWLEGRVEQGAGSPGAMAADVKAAEAGKPVKSCHARAEYEKWGIPSADSRAEGDGILNRKIGLKIMEDNGRQWKHETKPGPEGKAPGPNPATPAARPGQLLKLKEGGAPVWLHPAAARAVVAYFHDALLAGHGQTKEVCDLLVRYRDASAAAAKGNAADLAWSALSAELSGLVQRADGPYDYYGNPAGWVPMLSFQTNLALFDAETEDALRTLFLAHWIEKTQNRQRKAASTVQAAIERLGKEAAQAEQDYQAAVVKITTLDARRKAIVGDIATLENKLADMEKDMKRLVREDLQREHLLRGAFKVVGGVMQLVPVGQPVLGAFGKATRELAEIDFDKPFKVAPKVLSAFSGVAQEKLLPKVSAFFKEAGEAKKEVKKDAEKEKFDKALAKEKFKEKVKKTLDEQKEVKEKVVEDLGGFAVKESEIEERLARVAAECPELKTQLKALEELNARKAAYAEQLLAAVQALDEASSVLLTSQLATVELRAERDATLGQISHGALQFAREMGERARRRLMKYQYYLLKSYQYLMLSDTPGMDFRALKLFGALADQLDKSNDGTLTDAQFKALRAVFREQLKEEMVRIIDLYQGNAPSLGGEFVYTLTAEQLETLNNSPDNRLELDLLALGGLDLREENVRITNVEAKKVELASPPASGSVTVNLSYLHDGSSRLRRRGHLFLFRSGDYSVGQQAGAGNQGGGGAGAQRLWGTTVHHDGRKQTLKPMLPDPAAGSLLRYLVGSQDKEAVLYFRPAAWSVLGVQLSTVPGGANGTLRSLRLKVSYVSDKVPDSYSTVLVRAPDEARPLILCDAVDANGRADGQGTFLRTFEKGGTPAVTLRAPARLGPRDFRHWRVVGTTDELVNDTSLKLNLRARSAYLVEPVYKPENFVPVDEKEEPWPPCPVGWGFDDWLLVNGSGAALQLVALSTRPFLGSSHAPEVNQPQGDIIIKLSFDRLAVPAGEAARISVCTNPHLNGEKIPSIAFEFKPEGDEPHRVSFDGTGRLSNVLKIRNNAGVMEHNVEIDAGNRTLIYRG